MNRSYEYQTIAKEKLQNFEYFQIGTLERAELEENSQQNVSKKNFYYEKTHNQNYLNDNKNFVDSSANESDYLLKKRNREESDSRSFSDQALQNQRETEFNSGRWTQEEHEKFLEALLMYGNEWRKVQNYISTRSSTQARSHAQKFFLKLKKNLKSGNKNEDDLNLNYSKVTDKSNS